MRMQIDPTDFLRAKLVKPGWYVTFLKDMVDEPNSKKDGFNTVLDAELAEKGSEFYGVPVKHWFSEKGVSMPGGAVAFILAFNQKLDQSKQADIELRDYKGKFIYAKWDTDKGADGTQPPRNVVKDWAPIPLTGPRAEEFLTFVKQNEGQVAVAGVTGFGG